MGYNSGLVLVDPAAPVAVVVAAVMAVVVVMAAYAADPTVGNLDLERILSFPGVWTLRGRGPRRRGLGGPIPGDADPVDCPVDDRVDLVDSPVYLALQPARCARLPVLRRHLGSVH